MGRSQGRGSSEVQWHALQVNLEQAESDVLILLDCCAAGSAMSDCTGPGTKEMLVACGFETWTPGVGVDSFTSSLIEELSSLRSRGPFTVAVLHGAITRNIIEKSDQRVINGLSRGTKSPLHYRLTKERWKRSIELAPLNEEGEISGDPPSPYPGTPTVTEDYSMPGLEYDESGLAEFFPDKGFKYPKALLTITLENNQWLHEDAWISWLKSIPALVRHANIEAEFAGLSSVLLISVPIPIWDLMDDHPAIQFVAFIKSNNRLSSATGEGKLKHRLLSTIDEGPIQSSLAEDFATLSADTSDLLSPPSEDGALQTPPVDAIPSHYDSVSSQSVDADRNLGAVSERTRDLKYRRTVWYCCNPGCINPGPYILQLHADCTLGCQQRRCSDCKIEIVGP